MESIKTTSEFGKVLAAKERSTLGVYVKYTLFESAFQVDNRHIYSICLETRSDHGTEIVSACDICREYTKAVRLFNLLVDGLVTSCTLYEILEDIL